MSRRRQSAAPKADVSVVEAALKNEIRDASSEIASTEIKSRRARQIK